MHHPIGWERLPQTADLTTITMPTVLADALPALTVAAVVGLITAALRLSRRVSALTEQQQRSDRDQVARHEEAQAAIRTMRAEIGVMSVRIADQLAAHGAAIGELRGRVESSTHRAPSG